MGNNEENLKENVKKLVTFMEECEKTWKNWKENVEKLVILMEKLGK